MFLLWLKDFSLGHYCLVVDGELLLVEGISDDALELVAEGVGHEFFDVHHGHVVFTAEPVAFFANLGFAKISAVSSWHFLARAVVLPEAVFEEGL